MGDVIITGILIVIFFVAIRESVKHFKGQGGCCGGGSTVKVKKKKLKEPILGTFIIAIDGMHCKNCKNQVEGKINDLEGVACRVNLNKKTASVTFNRDITKDEIQSVIEKSGYTVLEIKRKEV